MKMENWSEILVDKEVLQYPVYWSSLKLGGSLFATQGTTGTIHSLTSKLQLPKPEKQPV